MMKRNIRKYMVATVAGLVLGASVGVVSGVAEPSENWTGPMPGSHGPGSQGMKGHGMMHKHMMHKHMLMTLADKNGDRSLSKAEMDAFHKEWLARSDKNGDGALNLAEFDAMHEAMREEMRNRHMQKRFEGLDSNKDGKISLQEMQEHADKRFEMMDRNKDGELNREDRKPMKPYGKR